MQNKVMLHVRLLNPIIALKKGFPNSFIPSFSKLKLSLKDSAHNSFQQYKKDTPSFYEKPSLIWGRHDVREIEESSSSTRVVRVFTWRRLERKEDIKALWRCVPLSFWGLGRSQTQGLVKFKRLKRVSIYLGVQEEATHIKVGMYHC